MLMMIKRILKISGAYSGKIKLGIFFNLMKTVSMSLILIAVYVVAENLNHLTMNTVWSALGIVIVSILLRILFQWLMDITMSARGFDMFRDYRLTIGDRMRAAPMGYFSEQKLGSIQTVLTSTVTELEQYSMMAIMDLTGGVLMASGSDSIFSDRSAAVCADHSGWPGPGDAGTSYHSMGSGETHAQCVGCAGEYDHSGVGIHSWNFCASGIFSGRRE